MLYIGTRGSRDKYPLNVKWGKREGLARAIRTRPPPPLGGPGFPTGFTDIVKFYFYDQR